MAEEVEISNVGNGGTVASEETLARLLAVMERMGGSGASSKTQDLYNKSIQQGTVATGKSTKAQKENTTATNENTVAKRAYRLALSGLMTGLGQIAGSAVGLAKELIAGGDSISDFAQHIPLAGKYITVLTGLIDQNIDSFRTLSAVGATFGDGMNEIRSLSAGAGIPLGEFTSLVSENSNVMRMFGAGVTDGARQFANLSRELRTGPGRAFINMGYTATELNESLLEYAEFTAGQIGFERRNDKLSAQSAANYLETIDQLAAVTGKRRDQIREEMNAAQADQRSRLAMSRMTADEATRFAANLAEAPGPLRDALTDAADGVLDNELTQGLAVASETFRSQAGDIKNMNAQEYANFLATVKEELDAAGKAAGAGAEQIMKSGTGYGQALAMAAELRDRQRISNEEYTRLLDERQQQQKRDDALLNFSNTLRELRTTLMDALINSGIFPLVQDSFREVAGILEDFIGSPEFKEGIKSITTTIKGWIEDFKSFSFAEMWEKVKDSLISGLTSVITSPTVLAAIAGIFLAKSLISSVASAASSGIESSLSKIFGGGGASQAVSRAAPGGGGAGRSAGKAMGNIGAGAGKALGGLAGGTMKGIASGLSAMANPQVAIGAAVVAGVILVIGAAIAGASWLLGKSLPTLVDGIKSFEEIDGDKLKSAAVGMLAISGAMVAFGAGSAVAGLGALVGGITEGIGKLFGAEDPLDKMKRFADADIDAEKVKSNAEAMVAFSTAMAAAGGASAAEGLGSLVSGIAGGIGALFGGSDTDDIVADMIKFAAFDIDTAKVKNNAEAMVAFSGAMAVGASGSAAAGLGTLVSGIAGGIGALFGGDTTDDIFADMVKFAGYDIDTAKVKNNAEAMAAFSSAMASAGSGAASAGAGNAVGAIGNAIASFFGQDTPLEQVKEFGEMELNVAQIEANANAIKTMGGALSGFTEVDLDKTPIIEYTEAIKGLTEALDALNDELKQDNDTLMTNRADAGELLSGINMSSRGTAEGTNQLNTTMQQMLVALGELKDINTKVERNTQAITSGNIAAGYVSRN